MGCFGSSKKTKCRKQRYKVIRQDQKPAIQNLMKADVSLENSIKEKSSNLVSESREKTEVPLSLKRRKKVTFDTNVTTYEHIYDSTESLLEKNEKGETFLSDTNSKSDLVGLKTLNYRYRNCLESDDEVEDFDHQDYDLDHDDDDDDDGVSVTSMESIGLNRNGYVLSVLNPVENLTQWKALKSKGRTRKPLNFDHQKENSSPDFIPSEPKNRNRNRNQNQNQETVVDASLSNWLISLEKNTRGLNGRFLD